MNQCLRKIIEGLAAMRTAKKGNPCGITIWSDGAICLHRLGELNGQWVTIEGVSAELEKAIYKKGRQE